MFGGLVEDTGVGAGALRAPPSFNPDVPPELPVEPVVHGVLVGTDPGAVVARSPFTQ